MEISYRFSSIPKTFKRSESQHFTHLTFKNLFFIKVKTVRTGYFLLTRNTPEKIINPAVTFTIVSSSLPSARAMAVAITGCR